MADQRNITGTNIPYSALAGLKAANIDRYNHVVNRIKSELANGDTQSINDALFDIAYYSQIDPKTGQYGRGQGNSNVSKIHNSSWTVTDPPEGFKTWAEVFINSHNDVYVQDNNDVVSMDPNTGKVLVNMKDSDGNWGSGPIGAVISGDQSGLDANMKAWLSGNGLPGSDTVLPPDGSGPQGGPPGGTPPRTQMNLLAYRPWTQDYANEYLSGRGKAAGAEGLLTMDKTSIQPEYSAAYLPGEFRDPNTWAQWAETHEGHVPEGAWRRATMKPSAYDQFGNPVQNIWQKEQRGTATPAGTNVQYKHLSAPGWNVKALGTKADGSKFIRQASTPWDFTAPAHSQGNIKWQDWTPQSMNLTAPDAAAWEGFLKATDTSPVTTPNLLSTKKGGPIKFGT